MKKKSFMKNLLIYIGLILLVSGRILIREFNNLNEIWGFNFSRCIAEGLLPYKDFSMILTPCLPMISGIFLKIFGTELIVSRFLECFEVATILFTTYKILEKLNINKSISLLSTIGIYLLYSDIITLDYNWAVLLITLLTVYFEIKFANREYSFKRNFILGILVRICNIIQANSRDNLVNHFYRI